MVNVSHLLYLMSNQIKCWFFYKKKVFKNNLLNWTCIHKPSSAKNVYPYSRKQQPKLHFNRIHAKLKLHAGDRLDTEFRDAMIR